MTAVPIIEMNPVDENSLATLEQKTSWDTPRLRRCIILDFTISKSFKDMRYKGKSILADAERMPHINLEILEPGEVPPDVMEFIERKVILCTNNQSILDKYIHIDRLTTLVSGALAFFPLNEAIGFVLRDYFEVVETLRWLKQDWRQYISDFFSYDKSKRNNTPEEITQTAESDDQNSDEISADVESKIRWIYRHLENMGINLEEQPELLHKIADFLNNTDQSDAKTLRYAVTTFKNIQELNEQRKSLEKELDTINIKRKSLNEEISAIKTEILGLGKNPENIRFLVQLLNQMDISPDKILGCVKGLEVITKDTDKYGLESVLMDVSKALHVRTILGEYAKIQKELEESIKHSRLILEDLNHHINSNRVLIRQWSQEKKRINQLISVVSIVFSGAIICEARNRYMQHPREYHGVDYITWFIRKFAGRIHKHVHDTVIDYLSSRHRS